MTTLKITYLEQTVTMTMMKDGLKLPRILFSLEKRFPYDHTKMLSWAKKYANAEEAMESKRDPPTNRTDRGDKRQKEEPFKHDRRVHPQNPP